MVRRPIGIGANDRRGYRLFRAISRTQSFRHRRDRRWTWVPSHADERFDHGAVGHHFRYRSGPNHPTIVDDELTLGELERHFQILLNKENRNTLRIDGAHRLDELVDDEWREPFRRLVKEQHLGIGQQAAADGEHLLFAAGQGIATLGRALPEARKELIDPFQRPRALAAHDRGNLEILLNRQIGEDPPVRLRNPDQLSGQALSSCRRKR